MKYHVRAEISKDNPIDLKKSLVPILTSLRTQKEPGHSCSERESLVSLPGCVYVHVCTKELVSS